MKAFGIWLAIVAVVFGAYALITISMRDTKQVFVFVDTSNEMSTKVSSVQRELDDLDDRDHTDFALATGQDFSGSTLVHEWQSSLQLPASTQFFGPCSLDDVTTFAEASDADERVLITVAGSACLTDDVRTSLADWEIVELP